MLLKAFNLVSQQPFEIISLDLFSLLHRPFGQIHTEIAYVTKHRDEILSKMDAKERKERLELCNKLMEKVRPQDDRFIFSTMAILSYWCDFYFIVYFFNRKNYWNSKQISSGNWNWFVSIRGHHRQIICSHHNNRLVQIRQCRRRRRWP